MEWYVQAKIQRQQKEQCVRRDEMAITPAGDIIWDVNASDITKIILKHYKLQSPWAERFLHAPKET